MVYKSKKSNKINHQKNFPKSKTIALGLNALLAILAITPVLDTEDIVKTSVRK